MSVAHARAAARGNQPPEEPEEPKQSFALTSGLRDYYRLEAPIQADSDGGSVTRDPRAAFGEATRGAGQEIPHRASMEQAFGCDFSTVKAFPGQADAMGSLGARAAAQGDRVAFASQSPDAKLVAHELAHVVQQAQAPGAAPAASSTVSESSEAAEVEARAVSDRAAAGERVTISAAPGAGLHLEKLEKLQGLIKDGDDDDEVKAGTIVALIKDGGDEQQAMIKYVETLTNSPLAGHVLRLLHGKEEKEKETGEKQQTATFLPIEVSDVPPTPRQIAVKDLGGFAAKWGSTICKIIPEQIHAFPTLLASGPSSAKNQKKEVDPVIAAKGKDLMSELCAPVFTGRERALLNELLALYGMKVPSNLRNRLIEFLSAKILWATGVDIQPGDDAKLKPDYKIEGEKAGDCFHIGSDSSLSQIMLKRPIAFNDIVMCDRFLQVFNAINNGISQKVNKYDKSQLANQTVVIIDISDAPWLDPGMITWMCGGAEGVPDLRVKTLPLKLQVVRGGECFDAWPPAMKPGWQLELMFACDKEKKQHAAKVRQEKIEELKLENIENEKVTPCLDSLVEFDQFVLKYLTKGGVKDPAKQLGWLKDKKGDVLVLVDKAVRVCANDRKAVECIGLALASASASGAYDPLVNGLQQMLRCLSKLNVRGDFPKRFVQSMRTDKGSVEGAQSAEVELIFVEALLTGRLGEYEMLLGSHIECVTTLEDNLLQGDETPEFKVTLKDKSVQFVECKFCKPTKKQIQVQLRKAMGQVAAGPTFCDTLGIPGGQARDGLVRIDCIGPPPKTTTTAEPKTESKRKVKEEDPVLNTEKEIHDAVNGQFMPSSSRARVRVIEILYLDDGGKPQRYVYVRDEGKMAEFDERQEEKLKKAEASDGKKEKQSDEKKVEEKKPVDEKKDPTHNEDV